MCWYVWKWWRLAWSGHFSWDSCVVNDFDGRWAAMPFGLYILAVRRVTSPLSQRTLYKQVYHYLRNKGVDHPECVDAAMDAVEAYGSHPAVGQTQLENIVGDCYP